MRTIDFHVHLPDPPGHPAAKEKEELARYFGDSGELPTVDDMLDTYSELDAMAVVFSIDQESNKGVPYVGNDYVAEVAARHPERLIGFGSVNPWSGDRAIAEVERLASELGLRGLKFHPSLQEFFPNDERFYPLWERCAELGLPLLFHTGQTGVGGRTAGGGGVKLKYCRPIPHIDDVAADFPELTIVMAHPAVPWQEEQLSVALLKDNVFMDLSGWSPKYFRPILVQYARTILQDKVLFGSDYPVFGPDRWLRDFETLGFPDDVAEKILLTNAQGVLGLG